MTEEMSVAKQPSTPVEQVQQTPPQQVAAQAPSSQTDWKARYDGLVRKVEELTLTNRDLNAQLAAKTSELEQLKGQLVVKDAEKSASVSQRDQLLQSVTQEKTVLEGELAELRALKLKVEAIQELGRPELLKIANRIPGMTDKEALKTVLNDFASFADDLVQKRERDILAGVTPALSSAGNSPTGGLPASENEWDRYVNGLPLGSKERAKAMDDYWVWLEQKHSA